MVMTAQESLDLVFLPADSCCFIPVNFSEMDGAIGESDPRDTFPLAPTPSAKEFSDGPKQGQVLRSILLVAADS